jgi:hypothetical protein
MEQSDALDALHTFRESLYRCFDRRADALFELTDAILTAEQVPSPVHLRACRRCIVADGAAFMPRSGKGGSTPKSSAEPARPLSASSRKHNDARLRAGRECVESL